MIELFFVPIRYDEGTPFISGRDVMNEAAHTLFGVIIT